MHIFCESGPIRIAIMQVFNFVGGTAVTISEPISISSFVSFRHCEAGKIYREKKKKKERKSKTKYHVGDLHSANSMKKCGQVNCMPLHVSCCL